jgi:CHASE1-domain containing sensor protein
VPAGERDEYYPVYFVEPLKGNEAALGFDLASSPVRRMALDEAAASGKLAATGRISLVQEKAGQYGFLVTLPVYRAGADLGTPGDRVNALRGFALGVFRVHDIVEGTERVAASAAGQAMRLAVFDLSAGRGEQAMYPKEVAAARPDDLPEGRQLPRRLAVGGRYWLAVA